MSLVTRPVAFDRGVKVRIFAIDGGWHRECTLADISDSGARLSFDTDIVGLNMNEFFLALSATGNAYRRCRLVRIMGNQIDESVWDDDDSGGWADKVDANDEAQPVRVN